jgi:hypothetical protein
VVVGGDASKEDGNLQLWHGDQEVDAETDQFHQIQRVEVILYGVEGRTLLVVQLLAGVEVKDVQEGLLSVPQLGLGRDLTPVGEGRRVVTVGVEVEIGLVPGGLLLGLHMLALGCEHALLVGLIPQNLLDLLLQGPNEILYLQPILLRLITPFIQDLLVGSDRLLQLLQ